MIVAFIVLHYCQVDVTLDCINSLCRLKGNPQIVVVDNASPDGSGKILRERFEGSVLVHVILNDSNLGFAAANNIGYAYAKKEIGANVIAVLNNDTVIEDECFIDKLVSSSFLQSFHIVAPNIINKDGKRQNPFMLQPMTYEEIKKNYRSLGFLEIIYSIPWIGDLKANNRLSHKEREIINSDKVQEMIVPHGAAIIYTPLWVNNEEFAFYPGTFMYVEEIILYYYMMAHQYKSIYLPDFVIYHLEDVSTNTRFRNKRKRALFQIKQMKNSYRVLMKYIEQNFNNN